MSKENLSGKKSLLLKILIPVVIVVICIGVMVLLGNKEDISEGENTLVRMYKQAQKDKCTNEDGNCTNSGHLHIGDYVELKNPTSGNITISSDDSGYEQLKEQTYEITENKNQLNWRVLGLSDEGEIELVAGSPMKSNNTFKEKESPYLFLYGAKGYVNALNILNNIASLYKENDVTGYITSARSITQDDVNKVLGITTDEQIKQYNINPHNGWDDYGDEFIFNGQFTPEGWINKQSSKLNGNVTGYGYTVNSKNYDDAPFVTASDRIYNMLFENGEYGKGRPYWLASLVEVSNIMFDYFSTGVVRVDDGGSFAGFCVLFCSAGGEIEYSGGVRPVVTLKSDVTIEDVPKIEDKVEEKWEYSIPT